MAVAVKNSQGAASASPLDRPAVVSLLGAFYVLGSLGVVFKGVPVVWELLGVRIGGLAGGVVLGLAMMAAAIGLLYLGSWLLGSKPAPGVKGGVFVGSIGLVLVLLLTRWASLWAEHWAFAGTMSIPTGIGFTAGAGVVFLVALVWGFFHPWTQAQVLHLEEMGWFSTAGYKSLQGLRVRRATILGIMLLIGAGVWTLISHGTLRRGPADWRLDVPFTGVVTVTSQGDATPYLAQLPPSDKSQVRITSPGATGLAPKEFITADSYRKDVAAALSHVTFADGANKKVADALEKGEIVGVLDAVNSAIHQEILAVLNLKVFSPEVTRQLRELDQRTSMSDLSPLINEIKRQAQIAGKEKEDELRPIFDLPTAEVVVDRFVLARQVNPNVDPTKNIRVGLVEEAEFKYRQGTIVPTEDFDEEVARLEGPQGLHRTEEGSAVARVGPDDVCQPDPAPVGAVHPADGDDCWCVVVLVARGQHPGLRGLPDRHGSRDEQGVVDNPEAADPGYHCGAGDGGADVGLPVRGGPVVACEPELETDRRPADSQESGGYQHQRGPEEVVSSHEGSHA